MLRHKRPMRRIPLVAMLVMTACHRTPTRHPGEEYLKAVDFQGNKQISDKDLLDGLILHRSLTAGRAPDPYLVQIDGERLKSQYNRAGYFEADVQGRVERKADAATVIYQIQEGRRAQTHVTIIGLPSDVPIAKVRKQVKLAEGAPFNYEIYDAAKTIVLGVVQDAGYAHAKLDARVNGDLATHTANITLEFQPGPKCKFGTVKINGVDGDLADAVSDRLQFAPGDTYSNAAVAATQRELYGIGRFSTVQVQPDSGEGEIVNMTVAVSETARHQVTLGGGFGLDPLSLEVRGRAGYEVSGWPYDFDRFIIDLRPAYAYLRDGSGYEPRMRAVSRFERQDLLLTYAVGTVEVGYNYLAYEAYTELGPEGQLGYDLRLGSPHVKLHAGYLIHRYTFRRPSPLIDAMLQQQIGIDKAELVGAYQQAIIADLRDNQIEPRLGVYGALKVTEGGPYAGGKYAYAQVEPEVRGYVPLGPVVFAARARYGAIFGDVPATERYYAGGSTSQRGFSERTLSPSVTGTVNGSTITVPYGGAGLIDTSVEARFPIMHVKQMPLGGVVFLDSGDVTESAAALSVTKLNYAVGLGLRLLTVIGPARFDLGYRINRTGPDDPSPGSKFAFHLSLGEAF